MTIEIQFVKITTSETLKHYIEDKLEPVFKKYPWLIKAQVFIKKTNDHTSNNCMCEIEVSATGPRIYASSLEKNFEMAVKETLSDIEKQLKKRKETMFSH